MSGSYWQQCKTDHTKIMSNLEDARMGDVINPGAACCPKTIGCGCWCVAWVGYIGAGCGDSTQVTACKECPCSWNGRSVILNQCPGDIVNLGFMSPYSHSCQGTGGTTIGLTVTMAPTGGWVKYYDDGCSVFWAYIHNISLTNCVGTETSCQIPAPNLGFPLTKRGVAHTPMAGSPDCSCPQITFSTLTNTLTTNNINTCPTDGRAPCP